MPSIPLLDEAPTTLTSTTIDESLLTTGDTSPFLPGTKIQYAWDSTCLGLLKTCPRLYQYTIIDGWQARHESVHLRFGSEYHAALELFDHLMSEPGADRESALHAVIRETLIRTADWTVDETTRAGRYKNRRNLLQLIIDYIDHFDPDPAETYIKSDGTPAVELSFRFELDWGPESTGIAEDEGPEQPYLLCGHLDRVAYFNRDLYVLDRKTATSTLSAHYFDGYSPNNQMSLYTLAGKIVLSAPIRGVIIDAAQIKLEEPNAFARGFTYRTEDQLDEWLTDLRTLLSLAETYATRGHWPMNDTACGNYGGCKFREICSKSPAVRERFLAADFIKLPENERWNPLRSR